MILYGISFLIFLFVSFSLFFRSGCANFIKISGIAVIFLISIKYVIYQFAGGAFFSPSLPRAFILFMEALYSSLILLFVFLILWDVYLLINWLFSKLGMPVPQKMPSGLIKCGFCLIALSFGIYGSFVSVQVPSVRTVELSVGKLPESLNGFKIVQLSDLHIGPVLKKDWLKKTVLKTNSLNADVIALTGDYADGSVQDIGSELAPLAELKAKYGIFAITGNHEYYWNAQEWEKAINMLGIEWLNNANKTIIAGNASLVIAGITDITAKKFGLEGPDLEKALKNTPDAIKILLAHRPALAKEYLQKADIQLSGHTHGGIIFFLQELIAAFNSGFVNGAYLLDNKKFLYVSAGTGIWNGFSSRIGVPAEITEIILKRQN